MVVRKVGRNGRVRLRVEVTGTEWRRLNGYPDLTPLVEDLARVLDRLLGEVIDEIACPKDARRSRSRSVGD